MKENRDQREEEPILFMHDRVQFEHEQEKPPMKQQTNKNKKAKEKDLLKLAPLINILSTTSTPHRTRRHKSDRLISVSFLFMLSTSFGCAYLKLWSRLLWPSGPLQL